MAGKKNIEKLIPQALELEEAVLGAIMVDRDGYVKVSDFLHPHHFYLEKHELIFLAAKKLFATSKPIDLLTVTEMLRSNGKLEKVGGPVEVVELTNRVSSSANIETHARILVEKWMQRELIYVSTKVQEKCFGQEDVFDTLAFVDMELNRINLSRDNDVRRADQMLAEVMRLAKGAYDLKSEISGINLTGIIEVERFTNGAEPGDMIIVAGATGSGKSSLFTNAIRQALREDRTIYSWSGEWRQVMQTIRILSTLSGLSSMKIRKGGFYDDTEDSEKLDAAVTQLEGKGIYLDYGAMTLDKFASRIVNWNRLHGVPIFLFDRLELFDFSRWKDPDAGKQAFTKKARQLANELGVVIVIAVQVLKSYKARMGKAALLEDLRGSGSITDDATKVMFVNRPEAHGKKEFTGGVDARGKARIHVLKNSNGPLGHAEVRFDKKHTIFESLEADELSDDMPF